MPGTLLSLGHGYTARALSRRLVAQGWRVIGTTRDEGKAAQIRAEGAEAVVFPPEDAAALVRGATHLLVSAGPDRHGADPARAAMEDAIRAEGGGLQWAGYLSTTAVYGDLDGGWVDENGALNPGTSRGKARVAAEEGWSALAAAAGFPLHIFRLAGIYGPGRGPFAKVREGKARRIVKPGQVFSRIHVEDIATILQASMARPRAGAVYNVCDDLPAPPEDVIEEAARLLGLPIPPAVDFDEAEMTPMARSFYAECKRTSNALLRDELGVALAYPTYREGLRALLAEEG
ncbi:SDR family oxidoreductase [Rhodovulum sp. DZ06]|uniref:SDR family oxidoreductase n=1 Tax=Rhodovulum sp. DZ06 TaxID=3425126 RepID=UPI003D33D843